MPATATATDLSILARALRPFAGKKRAGILAGSLCRIDGDRLTITATDLDVCGVVSIPAPAGATDGAWIAGATGSPDDYPAVGRIDGTTVATISTTLDEVDRIAAHIVPATDAESSRYALDGVRLDWESGGGPAFAVGTDGRRMHVARFADHASGPAEATVPARLFTALAGVCRAAVRATGRRPGQGFGGLVVITITTTVAVAEWRDDRAGVTVRVVARLIEGRFPEWRRVIAEDADAVGRSVNGEELSAWCHAVTTATAAAAKAAGLAEDQRRGAVRRRTAVKGRAEGSHPRGVTLDGTDAVGRGCPLRCNVGATPLPWTLALDSRYLAEALAGAVAWSGSPRVTIRATDGHSAVRIPGGGWDSGRGAGFLAVVMPLAQD